MNRISKYFKRIKSLIYPQKNWTTMAIMEVGINIPSAAALLKPVESKTETM